jgi:hypothetical protein
MRLLEFYGIDEALDEARSGHYTLEPEGNAMGRLLKWEVVAHGSIDELIAALPPEILAMPDTEEGIRQAWDDAVQNGEAVYVEKNIVDITTKVGKGDRNRDDSDYDYDRDNGNKYF